jgi:hypothetical protein
VYPKKLTTKIELSLATETEKLPFASVVLLEDVPFIVIMAPESALPVVASVTRPFIFLSAKFAKTF